MARLKHDGYTKAFSTHLRNLRLSRKMTLKDLGNLSGLDLASVQRIEKTNGNVTTSTIFALAKGLDLHPKELLNFEYEYS